MGDVIALPTSQPAPRAVRHDWSLALSWVLAPLAAFVSSLGLFVTSTYADEAPGWATQARAQDAIDLFVIVPALVVSSLMVRRTGSLRAHVVWLGALVSLAYAFAIYAFDVAYGPLFMLYVACLGLSAWALAGGVRMLDLDGLHARLNGQRDARRAGVALAAIGVCFYILWLAVNVPAAIHDRVPAELGELGLPTNPVHVLDMALLLPACLVGGIALWRGRRIGAVLVPILLVTLVFIAAGIEVIFAFTAADDGDAAVLAPAVAVLVPLALAAWALLRVLRLIGSQHRPNPEDMP
ncbi:MAG: hypothetical protein JWL76_1723 [Thermoleophilia bacterium]|nr:hypothetical protein [Thermoleophilia bacterium]